MYEERDAQIRELFAAGVKVRKIAGDLRVSSGTVYRVAREAGMVRNARTQKAIENEHTRVRAVWAELTRSPKRGIRAMMEATGIRSTRHFYLAIRQLESAGYIRSIDRHGQRGGMAMYEVIVGLSDMPRKESE